MNLTPDRCHEIAKHIGASNCAYIPVSEITFDAGLRMNCELNYCGQFGRTWVCPPNCGPIEECISKAKSYKHALIIQTISPLEDSYDFEGMADAMVKFHKVLKAAVDTMKSDLTNMYVLSAGSCHLCEECAFLDDEPCRHPDLAHPSVESHGIFVAELAPKVGMQYINGKNTVTYFGAILFNDELI